MSDEKNKNGGATSKDAKSNRIKGDNEIKTSFFSCKFKPNCMDAIPFYKLAATQYHNQSAFEDEIYCREKLAFCYRNLVSEWEEGREYEQVAIVYLTNLNNPENAFKAIQNAHQGYFIKADYKDAVNCLVKLSESYLNFNQIEYAEKCLKLGYDDCLTVFHTVATKVDEDYGFIYTCVNAYISLLFRLKQLKFVITVCQNAIAAFEPYENNKSRIIRYYGFIILANIACEDRMGYETSREAARIACGESSEISLIETIEDIALYIEQLKEKEFKRTLNLLQVDYDIEVVKRIKEVYDKRALSINSQAAIQDVQVQIEDENDQKLEVIELDDFR